MAFDLFPDYFDRPEKVRFANQEEDERIELLLRQHWIVNVPWITFTFLGFLLPFIITSLDQTFGFEILSVIPLPAAVGMVLVLYLVLLGYAIESYLSWYFNIYIVTNLHIVDINFYNLLNRDITESRLEDIQSARSRMSGIIRSLFNFGDVIVETAAEMQNISFINVPHPDLVTDRIQDLQRAMENRNAK